VCAQFVALQHSDGTQFHAIFVQATANATTVVLVHLFSNDTILRPTLNKPNFFNKSHRKNLW